MSKKFDTVFLPFIFLLLFFYQLFVYQPFLLYSQFQPAFYFDSHFIQSYLIYPGGVGELLSLFIFQFFVNNVVASILFSLILFAIFVLVRAIFYKQFKTHAPSFFVFLPLLALMVFYNAYNVPLVFALKYMLVLLVIYFYSFQNTWFRTACLLLMPLLYFIFGGWFTLMLVAHITAIHIISKWRLSTLVPLLFIGMYVLSAYLSARFFFYILLKEAFIYVLPFKLTHEPIYFATTFLFYVTSFSVPILLILWRVVEIGLAKFETEKKSSILWPSIFGVITILIFAVAMMFSDQPDQKRKNFINHLAENAQWNEVLAESKKMREYNRMVEFQTNRAMYFTGCLLDSLFEIDHPVGVNGLFVDRIMGSQVALHASDLYYDLGHINAAQVMAYEFQTKYRYDPRVLKRLALTNAINGHYSKAEKFIMLLKKSPMHRAWAVGHSSLLNEQAISNLDYILIKRQQQPKEDFFIHSQSPYLDMLALLRSDENNKMAYEYLMSYYLLECRLGNIAKSIDGLKTLNYPDVPRHVEEAAIMYQTGAQRTGRELITEIPFRRDRVQEFAKFNEVMVKNTTNDQRKAQLVKQGLTHTFWFYLFDGGGNRTDSMKKRKLEGGY